MFAASEREFAEQIPSLRRYRVDTMQRLASLPRRDQRDFVRKVLRDKNLARLYSYEGFRGAGQLGQVRAGDIEAHAERCNPFRECVEPVQILHTAKGVRAKRRVQNFGPLKRMHQLLVADVIRALHPPRPDQYLYRGGMPMALRAIEAAHSSGHMFGVELDFVDFYGSIRFDGLADLLHPLPSAVVSSVVWDARIRRGLLEDITVPLDAGHPSLSGVVGLSLGAASSPIVGERIIGHLLGQADFGTVVTYADNVLFLGSSRAEVEARAERLREVADRLEAMPLRPRINRSSRFSDEDGVEFAKQVGRQRGNEITWAPNEQRMDQHRLADRQEDVTLDQISQAVSQISHWRRAYPRWQEGDAWEVMRRAELLSHRYYLSAQPENLTAARDALLMAYLSTVGTDELFPSEIAPEGTTRLHRQRRDRLLASTQELWTVLRSRLLEGRLPA